MQNMAKRYGSMKGCLWGIKQNFIFKPSLTNNCHIDERVDNFWLKTVKQ